MKTEQHVLVIDDDPEVGEFICQVAQRRGIICIATCTPEKCLSLITPETALIFLERVS